VGVRPQGEAGFQEAVVALAKLHHWLVFHARPARSRKGWQTPVQGDAGFLDLVLVATRPPLMTLFRELKFGRGRLTEAQRRWAEALRTAGQDVGVWRETGWAEIVATLSREGA
jgi:hypothetical protein